MSRDDRHRRPGDDRSDPQDRQAPHDPARRAEHEGAGDGNPGPRDGPRPANEAEDLAGEGEWEDDDEEPWDAHDERRQKDQMAPPAEPCECYCLHCGRTFASDGMWFQRVIGDPQGFEGFWMCPTPNCSGAGFTFDIFPTDPNHPANAGWHSFDEDDEEYSEDDDEGEWSEDGGPAASDGGPGGDADYDPDEPKYKALDGMAGGVEDDDDLEGEEWKYGLAPGERPPPSSWADEGRRAWEAEQRSYDEPDERPRELDWSDREDRRGRRPEWPPDGDGGRDPGDWREDDIPF